tara:strand:+ start:80 stop:472 length:393 start_codon:yes stop_codon:yes gene_type:complete
MSWNYRVIEHEEEDSNDVTLGDSYVQIHEVYYDDEGDPLWMTQEACAPFGDNDIELAAEILLIQKALEKPILKATIFDKENNPLNLDIDLSSMTVTEYIYERVGNMVYKREFGADISTRVEVPVSQRHVL